MVLVPLFTFREAVAVVDSVSLKKHTLLFVPCCTALLLSMERTVQLNQMIVFLGPLRTPRPLFFWALLYGK